MLCMWSTVVYSHVFFKRIKNNVAVFDCWVTLQYCSDFRMKCSHYCDRRVDGVCLMQRPPQPGLELVIDCDAIDHCWCHFAWIADYLALEVHLVGRLCGAGCDATMECDYLDRLLVVCRFQWSSPYFEWMAGHLLVYRWMVAVEDVDSLDFDDCAAPYPVTLHNCCSECACAGDDFPQCWSYPVRWMWAEIGAPLQCDSRRVTLEEILQSRTTKSTYSHIDKEPNFG